MLFTRAVLLFSAGAHVVATPQDDGDTVGMSSPRNASPNDGKAYPDFDASNLESVEDLAGEVVASMMTFYTGDQPGDIPGILPDPYFWIDAGAMMDSLVYYWAVTGDSQLNDLVATALLFQRGPNNSYMPVNQTKTLGNDDQATWALAALTAAEYGFPLPQADDQPFSEDGSVESWMALAEAAFNTQVAAWEADDTCGGGLRWQKFAFNNGYDYKNALSQADMMQMAARLYHQTNNQTYADWADRIWNWSTNIGLVDTEDWRVYDGTDTAKNCSELNQFLWTSTTGTYLTALTYMENASSSNSSKASTSISYTDAIVGLTRTATELFTPGSPENASSSAPLFEVACQPSGNCNIEQLGFRGVLARALSLVSASDILNDADTETVQGILQASAEGAANQCVLDKAEDDQGEDRVMCGSDWQSEEYDGEVGVTQYISTLEVLLANLDRPTRAGRTSESGGGNGDGSRDSGGNGGNTADGGGDGDSPQQAGENSGAKSVVPILGVAVAGVAGLMSVL